MSSARQLPGEAPAPVIDSPAPVTEPPAPVTEPPAPVIDMPVPPPGSMGPPEEYARLRESCPVARVRLPMGATAWYVTRYDDVRDLIADSRLIRPTINDWPPRPDEPTDRGPALTTMMELNGPQHTALRKALAEPFSVRTIQRRLPRIRRSADRLLDAFADGDRPGDLVGGYLEPFPLLVMCDLVGIPYEDRDYFLPMADAALGALVTLEEGRDVTRPLREYIRALVDRKLREPDADLLTTLVRECGHGTLHEESVLSFGLSMLVAGYRTSTMFLGNAVVALLTEPGRYARLRDDRGLMPGAVEELLRYIPVMNGVVLLQAVEDIELRGRTIRAGDAVLPVIASANRDETAFPAADQLDLHRTANNHLAFGRGTHNCPGSHLARAELTVGLEALLDRLPHLHLTEERHPTWDDESPSKSPLTLPVGW
ncbi:cytochrome P450 [Streptomyces sp. NPDC088400]|uniref:cytochrome P450 n=1 Tax=Streptomyces sp. NPDC088400 TaxID=3365861 RepID=UPI003829B165